jgi:hypothetical protein
MLFGERIALDLDAQQRILQDASPLISMRSSASYSVTNTSYQIIAF